MTINIGFGDYICIGNGKGTHTGTDQHFGGISPDSAESDDENMSGTESVYVVSTEE